jgi:hypothetical protein
MIDYMKDLKVAIVISSCDAFQECWEPFIFSMNKYWVDCPWDVYIVSNFNSINSEKVNFILVGEDKGWASNLKKAISHIDADYIVYLQEDYFLDFKVDSAEIKKHLIYCSENNIDYLRLFGPFFDEFAIADTPYSISPKSKKYRLCLRNAIWNKKSLDEVLIEGYTGWQFEWDMDKYLKKNNITIKSIVLQSQFYPQKGIGSLGDTAVHKGMWTQSGYDYLKEHGFEDILVKRPREGELITSLIHNKINWLRPFCSVLLKILIKYKINI